MWNFEAIFLKTSSGQLLPRNFGSYCFGTSDRQLLTFEWALIWFFSLFLKVKRVVRWGFYCVSWGKLVEFLRCATQGLLSCKHLEVPPCGLRADMMYNIALEMTRRYCVSGNTLVLRQSWQQSRHEHYNQQFLTMPMLNNEVEGDAST